MKEEIAESWSQGSKGYDKYVMASLSAKGEKSAWQNLFHEKLGGGRLKVLDIGTGPGIMAICLADMGHRVTAIDLADGMLAQARKNSELYGVDIEFRKADAEQLPFEDGSFDAVVSRWVLWTLPNPEAALKEWMRVLKPGGKLVYADGIWTLKGAKMKAKYHFARFLATVNERRNAWGKRREDHKTDLWSYGAERPEMDIRMLQELGVTDIEVTDDIARRTLKGIQYLKYGFWEKQFLISVSKSG